MSTQQNAKIDLEGTINPPSSYRPDTSNSGGWENNNIHNNNNIIQVGQDIQQQQPNGYVFTLGFKLLMMLGVGGFLMFYRIFAIPTLSVPCILDRAFEALSGLNQTINNNPSLGKGIIISTSLLIDFFCVTLILFWLFKGKSMRAVLVIFLFYFIRLIHLYMYTPRFPDGFFFPYPGFPSIMVPYGRQSDFYFSGHCGILTISVLEWHAYKNWKLFYLNLIALIYTAFSLLALRVHYFIDISAGIVFAHWIYLIVSKYERKMDDSASMFQNWLGSKFKACALCKPKDQNDMAMQFSNNDDKTNVTHNQN